MSLNENVPPPAPSTKSKSKPPAPKASSKRLEQLYRDGGRIREAQKKKKEERDRKECTFKPKLLTKRRSPKTKSSSKSLYEDASRRAAQLRKLREEAQAKECTFKPKINHRKKVGKGGTRADAERHASLRGSDRLYQQAKRQRALLAKRREDEKKKLSFKPKISKKIVSRPRKALYDPQAMEKKAQRT